MKENQTNEFSNHQLTSAVTSDKSVPNILTLSSFTEPTTNSFTQISLSGNTDVSTSTPQVKRFKPAVTSTPVSKYVFKTSTAKLLTKLFGGNDPLVKEFDKEKLAVNANLVTQDKLLCIIAKLEVKVNNLSDELKIQYKNWGKQWLIDNNLLTPTIEDVRKDPIAKTIKQK